jgi:low temperature requirement protein LtrA
MGYVDIKSLLYFAIFWNIWSKEASYTSRFDTTDLSAQMENLITCFAVLFGSLSVSADLNSVDGTRIMIMASAVAILHCALHIRVAISNYRNQTVRPATLTTTSERTVVNPLTRHVFNYALFIIIATALEAATWMVGIFLYPYDWPYRWCIVVAGIVLGLRVPRAFLANDFHGSSIFFVPSGCVFVSVLLHSRL